jgi:hypothetical protein
MSLDEAEALPIPHLTTEQFAATGAPKVTEDFLGKLRERLRIVLREAGYPQNTLAARQSVDRALAADLASMNFPVGEMLRPDTWTWLAVHLLPEYAHWRWVKGGKVTEERLAGPVLRNALGRLWLRGWVFDPGESADDRWAVVNSLPEDATVVILERTSVSSNHRLARAIARSWLGMTGRTEGALRDAGIRARVDSALFDSSVLSDSELEARARELVSPTMDSSG